MSQCKVGSGELSRRLQTRIWQGLAATGGGTLNNYAYVVSDLVPGNKYWAVFFAAVLCDDGVPTDTDPSANNISLYLLNRAAVVPPNIANQNGTANTYKQNSIFLNRKHGASDPVSYFNMGPLDPSMALKIDDSISFDVGLPTGVPTPYEIQMLRGRDYLIVPEGFCLLATNWYDSNNGGQLGAQLTLKIFYAELKQSEDIDI